MKFKRRHLVTGVARVWGTPRIAPDAPSDPALPGATIFDRFEALGDSGEFGAVQQLVGLDRPALFTSAAIEPATLAALLDHDLVGLDNPGHFDLHVDARSNDIGALRRAFMADARAARRIYLYHSREARSPDDIARLHAALRRFGPNRLLFVRPADEDLAAGELWLRAPGFAEAAIDVLAAPGCAATTRSAMWPLLFRRALALLDDAR